MLFKEFREQERDDFLLIEQLFLIAESVHGDPFPKPQSERDIVAAINVVDEFNHDTSNLRKNTHNKDTFISKPSSDSITRLAVNAIVKYLRYYGLYQLDEELPENAPSFDDLSKHIEKLKQVLQTFIYQSISLPKDQREGDVGISLAPLEIVKLLTNPKGRDGGWNQIGDMISKGDIEGYARWRAIKIAQRTARDDKRHNRVGLGAIEGGDGEEFDPIAMAATASPENKQFLNLFKVMRQGIRYLASYGDLDGHLKKSTAVPQLTNGQLISMVLRASWGALDGFDESVLSSRKDIEDKEVPEDETEEERNKRIEDEIVANQNKVARKISAVDANNDLGKFFRDRGIKMYTRSKDRKSIVEIPQLTQNQFDRIYKIGMAFMKEWMSDANNRPEFVKTPTGYERTATNEINLEDFSASDGRVEDKKTQDKKDASNKNAAKEPKTRESEIYDALNSVNWQNVANSAPYNYVVKVKESDNGRYALVTRCPGEKKAGTPYAILSRSRIYASLTLKDWNEYKGCIAGSNCLGNRSIKVSIKGKDGSPVTSMFPTHELVALPIPHEVQQLIKDINDKYDAMPVEPEQEPEQKVTEPATTASNKQKDVGQVGVSTATPSDIQDTVPPQTVDTQTTQQATPVAQTTQQATPVAQTPDKLSLKPIINNPLLSRTKAVKAARNN